MPGVFYFVSNFRTIYIVRPFRRVRPVVAVIVLCPSARPVDCLLVVVVRPLSFRTVVRPVARRVVVLSLSVRPVFCLISIYIR